VPVVPSFPSPVAAARGTSVSPSLFSPVARGAPAVPSSLAQSGASKETNNSHVDNKTHSALACSMETKSGGASLDTSL